MSYGNVFELNLVTRVDMLRGEIFCESGGVNGRDEKLDWNYVSAGGHLSCHIVRKVPRTCQSDFNDLFSVFQI